MPTILDPKRPTLVLADDHLIVRESLGILCAGWGFHIVGQCSDGLAAVEMILNERPDFAIIDLQIPLLTGLDVIRQIRAAGSQAKLLILSITRDPKELIFQLVAAGADAYLLKEGPSRHLVDAINFIRDGGVYISPLVRGAGSLATWERNTPEREDPLRLLNRREAQVFSYTVRGLASSDIANVLNVRVKTVIAYRAALMRKLNLRNSVELVKFAIQQKLMRPCEHA